MNALIEEVYGDIDKVESFVGGLGEDHMPGSAVGEFFWTIIREQYLRSRDGGEYKF